MIDFLQGHILIAYRNSIIYVDVEEYGIDKDDLTIPADIARGQDEHYIEVVMDEENDKDKILELNLLPKYKIICIQEIGNEMSAFVIEDVKTRQVRFLRAYYSDKGDKKFKLVQLGVLVNSSKMSESPLLKYRAVNKTDPVTKKHYTVGIVLRQNGRFEVYSDFMLVNEYVNPHLQCVDIETDFNNFFLKFVVNSN